MTTLAWLAIAYGVTFVINVIPAFMPATWTVLSFFYVRYKLPLLVLTVGGAAFSTLGRLVLALAVRRWGRKIVPAKKRTELDALSRWLNDRPSWQVPLVIFIGSAAPFPSNQLFVAAGLTTTPLAPVALGFFVGRSINYTVAAVATSKAASNLENILRNYWSSPSAWLIQILSLAGIVIFTMIPWSKVLHISIPTGAQAEQSTQVDQVQSSTSQRGSAASDTADAPLGHNRPKR